MRQFALFCLLLMWSGSVLSAQDTPTTYRIIEYERESIVSFSPNASRLVIVSPDNVVSFYNPASSDEVVVMPLDSDQRVEQITWSDDNQKVLINTWYELHYLNIETGSLKRVVRDEEDYIYRSAFWDDRIVTSVATTSSPSSWSDFEIYVWDANTLEQLLFLPAGDDCLLDLPADPEEAELVHWLRGHGFGCYQFRWNSAQTRYLNWAFWHIADLPEPIEIYDTDNNLLFKLHHCSVWAEHADDETCPQLARLENVAWSPDDSMIMSLPGYGEKEVKLWDAETGALLHTLRHESSDTVILTDVRWLDEKRLATWGEGSDPVSVWDTQTGKLIFALSRDYMIDDLFWIYEGRFMVGSAGIWNAYSGEHLAFIVGSKDKPQPLRDIAEDPENDLLYLIFEDYIDVWDLEAHAAVWTAED